MKNDKKIEIKVIAFPNNIKEFPNNNEYIFWNEKIEGRVINSIHNGKWYDLKKQKPDYVFIQRPYDIYLPAQYSVKYC